jgi:hypothetical protein
MEPDKASVALQVVHTDVCGPLQEEDSSTGARYFVTFVDEATHYLVVYLLKTKAQVGGCVAEYIAMAENKQGAKIGARH